MSIIAWQGGQAIKNVQNSNSFRWSIKMLQDEKKQIVQLKNLPDSISVKDSELLNQQLKQGVSIMSHQPSLV